MQPHHKVAIPVAGLVAAGLIADTVYHAATGHRSFFTDDAQPSPLPYGIGDLLVGLVFASLCWVVVRERARFERASRAVRWSRRPLAAGLAMLALGLGFADVLVRAAGLEDGPVGIASGVLGDRVLVRVGDDGPGPRGAGRTRGYGLVGLTERVESVGGQVRSGAGARGGFVVEAVLPLDAGTGAP